MDYSVGNFAFAMAAVLLLLVWYTPPASLVRQSFDEDEPLLQSGREAEDMSYDESVRDKEMELVILSKASQVASWKFEGSILKQIGKEGKLKLT